MADEIVLLSALALAFSLASTAVQYTIGNRRRVQAIQKEMNDIQKEFQSAAKDKDEKKLKQLEEKQKRMMELMTESMSLQFKPMLVILPLFMLLFGGFGFNGFLNDWFPHFSTTLPIALHLNSGELLGLNVLHQSVYGVRGFFLVCVFFVSIFIQLALMPLVEKKLLNKQVQTQ